MSGFKILPRRKGQGPSIITPKGKAIFPKVDPGSPDEYEGNLSYNIGVVVSPEGWEELLKIAERTREEFLDGQIKDARGNTHNGKSVKVEDLTERPDRKKNEAGDLEDTGDMVVRLKMKAETKAGKKLRPFRMDHTGKAGIPDDLQITHGSTVRAQFQMIPYVMKGKLGVSLRLDGVQLLDLAGGGVQSGFGEEEGSYEAPESGGFSEDY